MEGTLVITRCGVNEVHGVTVYSDATTQEHIHGSWFEDVMDLEEYIAFRSQEEGFVGAEWYPDNPVGDMQDILGDYCLV